MVILEKILAVSRGEKKADLIFRNGRVVNVFSGEILQVDVVVCGNTIAAVGDGYVKGHEVMDLKGAYLIPGLIDAHVHVESSMLTPAGFARAVLSHGTTTVIADPHEIANAAGLRGLDFMVNSSRGAPVDFFFMVPSCVPATGMETAGAYLGAEETQKAFEMLHDSPGLGEMMNFPGVLFRDKEVISKIKMALEMGRVVDGHAPSLTGKDLNAYVSAGISSDHECVSSGEALEKIRLGMKVIIREGSAAKDLDALLPAVNEKNFTEFMFGCDDRHPAHLLENGEIDDILRKAVRKGLDPVNAVRMATINPARHYGLKGRGAVAPGYKADLVVVRDLKDFDVLEVYKDGRMVAKEGRILESSPQYHDPQLEDSVRIPDLRGRFSLEPPAQGAIANVITVKAGQIITGWEKVPFYGIGGDDDLAKAAVIERYSGKGGMSLGLVRGFGLKSGAIASTIAHDSHNLIVIGVSDEDMEMATRAAAEMGGGLVVVLDKEVRASLPLPVGGLMSYEDAAGVAAGHKKTEAAAVALGCSLPSPFMTLSFLALPVIPALKLTDRGLFDVKSFSHISLWD
ncbi:MAG: adenine deaminase [Bacillota bacterium]|nr:adenine deaminase [Bacillota bacterium]